MATKAEYGRRLIPQILDSLAAADPDRIVYSVAKSADISQGLERVSARTFAKAVDKTAWWIHNAVGPGTSCPPIGYIGPHDLRHILLTFAAVKAGYAALFLSPKNSTEGALAVLEAANCSIWVHPREQPYHANVEEFLQQRPMKILDMPELHELFDVEAVEHYPYTKTFEEAAQDPFCILHTSGSTGLPKPTIWSHGLIGTMDAVRLLPPTKGDYGMAPWTSDWNEGDTIYSSFPMSHGAGIIMDIIIPSLFAMPCVLGPVGVIPNMDLIGSLADYDQIDIWSMVPSLVDELGETPDILAKFRYSKFICASGGPTSPISASKVNEVVRVLNLTGTTEGLFIGNLWVKREDWLYFAFHPYSGFEFREVEPGSGVYEHWVRRNEHWPLFQGIFTTFPDLEEYNFKDLYVKHPVKPNHWAYKGRSDDIVVLSNGFKISPLHTESFVSTHPAVSGCLVVGSGKSQAALLIELEDSSLKDDRLVDSIWKTVEKATATSLHRGQLHKDYILFSDPNQPFIRTDKRTIKRQATLELYNDYIDRFYESQELNINPELALLQVDTSSIESIQNALRHILTSIKSGFQNAAPDTDFFDLGLDSLLVFKVIRDVKAVFGLQQHLGPRHIYANPTLAKFSAFLAKLVTDSKSTDTSLNASDNLSSIRSILAQSSTEQSFRLSGLDKMIPRIYLKMMVYIPLKQGVSFNEAFSVLQGGLLRTIGLLPSLNGTVVDCSKDEPGYKPGDTRIACPPQNGTELDPRRLVFKDLSSILPSFNKLREGGFASLGCKDSLLIDVPWFPQAPADVMLSQANFVEGGCLLVAGLHHSCFDGTGVVTVLRAWAESCKYVAGDTTATCSWLEPDSDNRMLPYLLWKTEGHSRPVEEIDPKTWTYIALPAPKEVEQSLDSPWSKIKPVATPPTNPDHDHETITFDVPAEKIEQLMEEAEAYIGSKNAVTSADVIQAFYWQAMIRTRSRVQKEHYGKTIGPDEISILEMTVDGRPYFSSSLPETYTGNVVLINRPSMPVEALCSPDTSVGQIALLIREKAAHIRPSLVQDAYTLTRSASQYNDLKFAFMRLDGLDVMISNLMLLQMSALSFGGKFFEDGGAPEAMTPLLDELNSATRICSILPMRKDGGVDLRFGASPEEQKVMMADEEFAKYATFKGRMW